MGSSGLRGLMRGEANSAAYASQKATKSASGSSTGGGGRDPSGMAVEGMGGVVITESVVTSFVMEAQRSRTC